MDWIQTYTGRRFHPLAPRADELDLVDIAHALSLNCRFNGHCRCFYSVAEHCVRVADILPPELALWGLLHDAAEAYLADVPRPAKQQMPQFVAAEDRLLRVIVEHFGLSWPMPDPLAGTTTRPNGHSASCASLNACTPKGMPMIVTQSSNPATA